MLEAWTTSGFGAVWRGSPDDLNANHVLTDSPRNDERPRQSTPRGKKQRTREFSSPAHSLR